ncbi:hypothetical protein TRVA0_016S01442 [Trichomonascus vanleenenianus]|uniref:uncharacterized protein n=1 Tax=Trichomonascus vanleenenianus TaxID=2268995 RepID=UPI003ECAE150
MFGRVFGAVKSAYTRAVEEFEEEQKEMQLERKRKRSSSSLNDTVDPATVAAQTMSKKRKPAPKTSAEYEEIVERLERRIHALEAELEEKDRIISDLTKTTSQDETGNDNDEDNDNDKDNDNNDGDDKKTEATPPRLLNGSKTISLAPPEEQDFGELEQLSPIKPEQVQSLLDEP